MTFDEWKGKFVGEGVDKSEKRDIILLPDVDKAVIPNAKIFDYALKDANKAAAFKSALGYTVDNGSELIKNIRDNLTRFNAEEKPDNGYGKRYSVLMRLKGANGKEANVMTAWIKDKDTGEMRLTSAYVDKK